MEKTTKKSESDISFKDIIKNVIVDAVVSLFSALISKFLAGDKDNNVFWVVFSISFISLLFISLSINLT